MYIGGAGALPPDDAFLLTFFIFRCKQVKTLRKQAQTSLGNTLLHVSGFVRFHHHIARLPDLVDVSQHLFLEGFPYLSKICVLNQLCIAGKLPITAADKTITLNKRSKSLSLYRH